MPFLPEPLFQHGQPDRTAILLVNLGTPDGTSPREVGRYLRQFLSDPALWKFRARCGGSSSTD